MNNVSASLEGARVLLFALVVVGPTSICSAGENANYVKRGNVQKYFADYDRRFCQAMACHLARCGMVVLVFDNIGQGEREPMGHAQPVVPFACGTTVEGLIALEAVAWLD